MATAEELLAGELIDTGTWFEVDLLSRRITIPKEITNLGAKGDEDFMRARFKLPRFYYDIDFADFELGIDYTNAEGEEDRYEPKDVVVGDDIVTFTWVVGRHAALYNGNVTFGLCAKRLNPADPDDPFNEFHTTKASLPILDAMETCEEAIIEHTDLLEQWRRDLFGIGDTEEQRIKDASAAEKEAIANEGARVLATIPVDYQTAVSMTDNADRTKADAIICSAQGEVITVSDSSDDYIRGLKIFGKTTQITTTGKNLLDVKNSTLGSCRYNNGVLTSAIDNYYYSTCKTDALNELFLASLGKTFTLSCDKCPNDKCLSVVIFGTRTSGGGHQEVNGYLGSNTLTFTISTDFETITYVEFRWNRSYTAFTDTTTTVSKLQLELGSTATAYEPYSGGVASPSPDNPQELVSVENPEVTIHGKNMFDPHTCKIYNDQGEYPSLGTATISGNNIILQKSSAAAYFYGQYVNVEIGQPYTVSFAGGKNVNGDVHAIYIYIDKPFGSVLTTLSSGVRASKTFIPTTETIFIGAYVCGNTTTTEQLVYTDIQLERGNTATEFAYGVASQALTIPRTLPGIPVTSGGNYTDADGQQWICDEIDFERGVYIKRVQAIELTGTEGWLMNPAATGLGINAFHNVCNDEAIPDIGFCSHFVNAGSWTQSTIPQAGPNVFWVPNRNTIVFKTDGIQTLEEFKALLAAKHTAGNPVTLYRGLKTPIETSLSAEELAAFQFAHTNFPNTTVINNAGAWMELKYNADTTTYLENCFRPTDEQVEEAVDRYLTDNPVSGATLIDTVTGKPYQLNVVNGKLTLIEVEV